VHNVHLSDFGTLVNLYNLLADCCQEQQPDQFFFRDFLFFEVDWFGIANLPATLDWWDTSYARLYPSTISGPILLGLYRLCSWVCVWQFGAELFWERIGAVRVMLQKAHQYGDKRDLMAWSGIQSIWEAYWRCSVPAWC
jgi:hypothetical protein